MVGIKVAEDKGVIGGFKEFGEIRSIVRRA